METDRYSHWAWMVRDMRIQALSQWRDQYAPAIAVDDLFARHLRRVRIVCDAYPKGVWHIAIKVQPRTASDGEWFFWKVRLVAGMYYIM